MNSPDPNLPFDPPAQPELPERRPSFPRAKHYPEDIDTPWGWADLFLLVAVTALVAFAIGNLVSLAFAANGITRQQIVHSSRQQSEFVLATQAILYVALLAYFYLRIEAGRRVPFWKTMGWRPLVTQGTSRPAAYIGFLLSGVFLCLLVTFASDAYGTKSKLPIQQLFQDRNTAIWFILMAVMIAPLVEETVFRGYIYPVLARSWGIGWSVLVTGTIFGVLHAQQLWGGWVQIGLLVVVGIVLTYVRAITKTVTASYLLHLGYNSFIAIAFLFTSGGYRSLSRH